MIITTAIKMVMMTIISKKKKKTKKLKLRRLESLKGKARIRSIKQNRLIKKKI